VQGVTREKASRVVEVLLSAVTPRQLLFGKIIGIGAVALVHAAVLIVTALVASRVAGLDVLDGFRLGDIAIGAVWFLLGYALYCCAFAAAGALCNRAEDAQGAAMPILMPMLAGYIVGFSAAGGASTLIWVLAYFPPTAVLCMPVLNALGVVPVWGVLLSMALTLATAYLIASLAARIYERSILRTGKRVSWREALRPAAD
jgi:ABC-2 type transport system permease protein